MDAIEVEALGPELAAALEQRGFTALTPVQVAVLDPELEGRDLRITSQTGSGKTVAIGLALRHLVKPSAEGEGAPGRLARPKALVLVPTRELARQVEEELEWLLAPLGAKVACVTGGSSYRAEHRALSAGPAVVVGTPGRLLDQLRRGAIDPSGLAAVALDEADRMLDMGFRDDIEAVFALAPAERRTHLVSATFPREVLALADRAQRDPAFVEGTPLGTANADIDHVVHLVLAHERLAAIVNLLLSARGEQTLLFVRTRADVTELSDLLLEAGFRVRGLSGELEQRDRERALSAFKRGDLDALVATDVAARGIDVADVARVIHAEAPSDPDSYTHRSGRTGRAGKKGTSHLLVPPAALTRATILLRRAGVRARIEPVPSADDLVRARDARRFDELSRPLETAAEEGSDASPAQREALPESAKALAARLVAEGHAELALARLLAAAGQSGPEPRFVTPLRPPEAPRARPPEPRPAPRGARPASRPWEAEAPARPREGDSRARPWESEGPPPSRDRGARAERPERSGRSHDDGHIGGGGFVPFRVSWGEAHGADPRRLLAMVCRRGEIRSADVGAIQVHRSYSVVEVAREVAGGFARSASAPDPRDPRVTIRVLDEAPIQSRDAAPRTSPPPAMGIPGRSPRLPRPPAAPAGPWREADSAPAARPKRAAGGAPPKRRPK